MRRRAIATSAIGLGVTLASTFAGSLGLSVGQERIGFAIGAVLMIVGVAVFLRSGRPLTRRVERRLHGYVQEAAVILMPTDRDVAAWAARVEQYIAKAGPKGEAEMFHRQGEGHGPQAELDAKIARIQVHMIPKVQDDRWRT